MTTTTERADRVESVRRWRALLIAVSAGIVVFSASSTSAFAGSPEDCVKEHMAEGQPRPEAIAACLRETVNAPSTTARPGGGLDPDTPDNNDVPDNQNESVRASDDGTSVGLLVAVGVGGVIVGAAAALGFRRRQAATVAASGAGFVNAPPPVAPPPVGAAVGQPFASPPPAPGGPIDRSGGLVTTLVDLSDRMSSGALRAEIVAALARAGVHALEPAQGDVFDANRMRGVGSATAPDPSWIGRVAGTERPGFADGPTVLRLPEVIVYTAGG